MFSLSVHYAPKQEDFFSGKEAYTSFMSYVHAAMRRLFSLFSLARPEE